MNKLINISKKIILSLYGLLQGSLGSYIVLLGWAFAFPETDPGNRDYEEDMSFVPLGYIIMFIWIIIMVYSFISFKKNKTNIVTFVISWLVGLLSFVIFIINII